MLILMTTSRFYVEDAALSNVMSDFTHWLIQRTLLCNAGGEILVLGAETLVTFDA
jgi:hypothetical protein